MDNEVNAALRLAKMWRFGDFTEFLIKRLESLNLESSRQLELARIHDIRKWYKPALKSLATREAGLTFEEGRRLGTELTVMVSILRELKHTTWIRCRYTSLNISVSIIEDKVAERLNEQLNKFSKEFDWDEQRT